MAKPSSKSNSSLGRGGHHDRERIAIHNGGEHSEEEEEEEEDGTTRGAHLKLAQRHRKLVAGRFRGRRVVEPEEAAPGVLGQLAVCFTTNGALPSESRITCELPDHGWRVLPAATVAPSPAAPSPSGGSPTRVNALLRLPQGYTVPSLKARWHAATRTLEFTLLANSESMGSSATIASDTPVVILIAGVHTPESATPQAECVVTAYEKLVVRHTAPASTRGGQIIDGPCRFTVSKILPGQLAGPKRWLPFSCCPGAVSDVSLSVCVNGAVPRGGKILIELPADGWDMPERPRVLLRNAQYRNSPVPALWTRAQHVLEITLDSVAVPMKSSVTLTVTGVQNPAKETLRGRSVDGTGTGSAAARITTLSPSGGVIDGPGKLHVASISELRDSDLALARASFDAHDAERSGSITLEALRNVFERAKVRLSDELYASLVVANLPVRMHASAVGEDVTAASDSVSSDTGAAATSPQLLESLSDTPVEEDASLGPDRISRNEFLSAFARVYAPAYRFGQELRLACGRGQVESVREWLSRGCDPNATDGSGWSAAHYAADYGHLDVLMTLLDMTAATTRATAAPPDAVSSLRSFAQQQQQPLNVDARDGCGWTPLMCAAANGHTHVVEKLLSAGAEVRLASAEGRTALHWASSRGMEETARVLMDNGADVAAVDRSGWSALHCATLHSSASCASLLAERGASVALTDRLQYVPAHYDTIHE